MLLLANLHPVAPAPPPGASIMGWIWVGVVLAVVALGGFLIASRR